MEQCDKYRVIQRRCFKIDPLSGKPRPYSYEEGVCLGTKELEVCGCDGDESRCDFYPEKRAKAVVRHCSNCKHFYNYAVECRLLNCYRAFSRQELEDKTFVTDAWEESK
jgi:hypothetical protein